MQVISFKIINKHCLKMVQKACIIIVAIGNKTQWIMFQATISSQVVYNKGILIAVFFTQLVGLDLVLYQELVIFSKIVDNNGFILPKSLFCHFRYCA